MLDTYNPIPETAIVAEFGSFEQASEYRTRRGGWLFVRDDAAGAVWFDASMFTPSRILVHPILRGSSGRLI